MLDHGMSCKKTKKVVCRLLWSVCLPGVAERGMSADEAVTTGC